MHAVCTRVGAQRADTIHQNSIRRVAPEIVEGTRLAATRDRRAPGMTDVVGRTSRSAGAGVAAASDALSAFLDGIRINEPNAQKLFFELIPFAVVEHADLTRGASAGYGKNSLGGVTNVVALRGDSPAVPEASMSVGSFGSLDLHVTAGASVEWWMVS